MAKPEPVEGYPNKTEAILALFQQGVDNHEIARRCKTTINTVRITTRRKLGSSSQANKAARPRRNRGKETVSQAGVWTPEIMEQVRRLYGLTLIEIAKAVKLPPREVLHYVIHGVVPPSANVQRVEDIEWRDDAAVKLPGPIPAPEPEVASAFVDADFTEMSEQPSREEDEAELAALESARMDRTDPVLAGQPVMDENARYYLRTAGGKYLHESCTGFVKEKGRTAYCQPPARIRRLFLRHPDFKDLIAERAE